MNREPMLRREKTTAWRDFVPTIFVGAIIFFCVIAPLAFLAEFFT